MTTPNWPFVGSEAITHGLLKKHELRARFRALFPDVYVPKDAVPTLHQRAVAGWLWTHRQGVIAGLTASALHGAKWIDATDPIELVSQNARRPRGLRTYDMRLRDGEYGFYKGLLITSPGRTAFDIARRGSLDQAVARLDALANATGVSAEAVLAVAQAHPGARNLRQLEAALDLHDAGAESPRETWLRLLVIRAGYRRPRTQIPVPKRDGAGWYYLDMSWEDLMLALEYDGEQHRNDSDIYADDIQRSERIAELGWTRLRVVKANKPFEVLRRLERMWRSRLPTDREIL
ncbi:hypothetical protein ACIA48_24130 [Mycobacterium sp. NPDC051804]|uniref:hypothetical protein n=1 Tax=Mycobacterium sp. NPDC051804 TaxID=3364295 RepID=UPI00379E22E6